jgi:hypothetical protein
MAIGDISYVEYQKTLTTTNTDSSLANLSSSYETQITSIHVHLQGGSGASTARLVTFYKNGTAAANELFSVKCDPAGNFSHIITDLRYKLTGTQTIYIKQDVGTDVNILIATLREQVS